MTAAQMMEDCGRRDRIRRRGFMILHDKFDGDREVYISRCEVTAIKEDALEGEAFAEIMTMSGGRIYVRETADEVFCEYDAVERVIEDLWEARRGKSGGTS